MASVMLNYISLEVDMSIITEYKTLTRTGADTDTALVYTIPNGYSGTFEFQVINTSNQTYKTVSAWTNKKNSVAFNEAGVIWKDYTLFDNTALVYDKLILSSGERLYVSLTGGDTGEIIAIQLKGFLEVDK